MEGLRFFPLGDSALTIEFGNEISVEINRKSVALADRLTKEPFPGFIEAVPAYASTSIFYDIGEIREHFPGFQNSYEAVSSMCQRVVETLSFDVVESSKLVEIPVRFGSDMGPDLEIVAERSGLPLESVIEIFTGKLYRVFMLGFLPGFPYMGEVDERIATTRRHTPRQSVPKGSVGIAGKQTGIYSLDSPGGWQIIGRTNIELFTPTAASPCSLRPGDQVRFVPVLK
jgi:inhibitor of KinA